ncbi:CLAVATA3/ESR (CLE)-related protein [Salix suchowensis]|nr:CLAVATA3/ESR (CLE)-related protein [Salix suchowensis]
MQHLKPKMSRLAFVHLLLAWLLLVASQPRFSSGIRVQAAEAVHFKLKPAQLASNSHEGNVLPVWVRNLVFSLQIFAIINLNADDRRCRFICSWYDTNRLQRRGFIKVHQDPTL